MITDAFTGSDGTGLVAYSANWAYLVGATTDLHLLSNRLALNNSGTFISARRTEAAGFPATQSAQIVLAVAPDVGGTSFGPAVRCQVNGDHYGWYQSSAFNYLFKYISGVWTQIGSTAVYVPSPGDVFTLAVSWNGSTNTLHTTMNGSTTNTPCVLGDLTDATISGASAIGAPGLSGYNNAQSPSVGRWDAYECTAATALATSGVWLGAGAGGVWVD